MNTTLLVDSGSDLPLNFIQNNCDLIDTIGMAVNIDGKDYYDDFGKTLTHDEFYNHLRNGVMPSTAQINSYRFLEKFEEHYKKGNALIYIAFTSGMSGTYNSALIARDMLIEKNPDADITVIDTLSASIGEGVLVVHAAEMLKDGCSKEEIVNWIENNKFKANHWFAVNDLLFLKKGGRISPTSAAVGTLLNVKPIITVDNEGKLKSYTNVRGRKKSIRFLVDKLHEHLVNSSSTTVIVGHGGCLEDALYLEQLIKSELNLKNIIISELSSTIASHVGPEMIALAFVGEDRELK